jgi:hypothetical protein
MTRLKEFAWSPYHNKHEGVRLLIQHLSDIYPRFDAQHCERRALYQALFPGEKHNQSKLAVIFTYSMRLVEAFLSQEQFEQEPPYRERLLLKQLRSQKQMSLYEKRLKQNETEAQQARLINSHWYYHNFCLAEEANNLFMLSGERKRDNSLQRKQAFLDRFYLAETLRNACEMKVRSRILKVDYHNPLLDPMMTEVERQFDRFGQEPLIAIYFRIYRMISSEDTQYYFDTLKTLDKMQAALSVPERKSIYNYLQNYCIKKINAGAAGFLEEIFNLYKAQLDQGLLLEKGHLSEWHYKNIVTTAIRLNELNWVHDFINQFKDKLPAASRDNAYRFNLASYYYAAGKLDEVLGLLTRVEYSDLRYNLGAKALLLRTYYDLEEYEALFSLADSFKQYLSRNQLMADVRRQGYHNLFKFTRRAASIRLNLGYTKAEKSQKELTRLLQDMQKAEAIFNKGWLEAKVEDIQLEIQKP